MGNPFLKLEGERGLSLSALSGGLSASFHLSASFRQLSLRRQQVPPALSYVAAHARPAPRPKTPKDNAHTPLLGTQSGQTKSSPSLANIPTNFY